LFCIPEATAETLTVKLQVALAASVAPARLTLADPAAAVMVPPQVPFRPLGVATISPAGIVSVKPIPLKEAPVFGLESVKVSEVLPFNATLATANALVKAGGWVTAILAEAVLPLPPSVEVTALVVLFSVPVAMAETFTAKVHAALAARVAPVRVTLPDPAVAAIVPPPQLPERPLGVATTRPAGSVSVNPIPLRELAVLGLDRAKVSEVVPFNATLAAPKVFEIVGGWVTGGGGGEPPEEPPPHA
jgi:hypothetical protein